MKKKSLSVKKKKRNNLILKYLNNKIILKVFNEFKKTIDVNNSYAAAISGGPDSLALAFFCKCISMIHKTKIKYYVVDHKLRKESTQEAKKVLQILNKQKINCKILTWKGPNPKSNLQSIARNKRYELLKNQCKKNKIPFLLLGHHSDDLYENFLLRILRGSGLKGMVSMDKVSKSNIDNITIIRPLLDIKKSDLKKISNSYFEEKKSIDKQILENENKLKNILEKLQNPKLDAGELQNFNLQKSNVEKNVNDLSQSLEKLIELNSEDLIDYSKIEESLEELKPELIEYSKKIQSEWKDLDVKINDLEISKSKLLNSFPEDIVKLYDQLKHNGVEIIAAYKNEDQCGCCGVSLTSSELDKIVDSKYNQCPYCQGVVI